MSKQCTSLLIALTLGLAPKLAAQSAPVAPRPAPPAARAEAPEVVVELAAVGEEKGSGEAKLRVGEGEKVEAQIDVAGFAPGGHYAAFLVAGTCAKPGSVIAPLGTVEIADDGNGKGRAGLATSLNALIAQAATVQLHPQGTAPTRAVLCGALPGEHAH